MELTTTAVIRTRIFTIKLYLSISRHAKLLEDTVGLLIQLRTSSLGDQKENLVLSELKLCSLSLGLSSDLPYEFLSLSIQYYRINNQNISPSNILHYT